MLSVPMFDMQGQSIGSIDLDPAVLGQRVRVSLLKQAIVAYRQRQRQDSARTKSRSDVAGSTRKIYRQKGTGNARMGTIRTCIRRGGGRAFAKRGPRHVHVLPKKMRRLARNSAILAKAQGQALAVVDGLAFPEIKTKQMATMLAGIGAERGCVLAMHEADRTVYLSGRNLPKTDIRILDELNAYEVLRRRKLILTKPAFERLVQPPSEDA